MTLDDLNRISSGWPVVDTDGDEIGTVVDVYEDHIVVEKGTLSKHELYVPVSSLYEIGDDRVVLSVDSDKVDEMGWRHPPDQAYERRQGQLAGAAPGGTRRQKPADTTTMTGAAFGAGAGVSSAGPLAPERGDQIEDRLGGSGRAGLGTPYGAEREEADLEQDESSRHAVADSEVPDDRG